MQIREITQYLESLAPLSSQTNFDNCGLIVGDEKTEINSVLISLDCTEEIVDEAIKKGCGLIISHHPIVFKGLKKLNGKNYVEKTVIKAIQNNIGIYAIHTNLDHYKFGVNYEISKRLNLQNIRILDAVESTLYKVAFYVPNDQKNEVVNSVFEAGAGHIGNYSECSFQTNGIGTYKPEENSNPFEGEQGKRSKVEETKVEVLVNSHHLYKVIGELKNSHPYEEVAYDIIPLKNNNEFEGSGMIGELENPIDEMEFLKFIKKEFNCGCIRHTSLLNKKIKKVALCGGAGSFLLNKAMREKADIFITGDFKYHEFFDAENRILIADIGHFESEQYTIQLISDVLKKKFLTFAVHLTEVITNPIKYL